MSKVKVKKIIENGKEVLEIIVGEEPEGITYDTRSR